MSKIDINVARLRNEAEAMHDSGYFVSALAQLITTMGAEEPELLEKAFNGYVVCGIMSGLGLIGSELMCRADELNKLVDQAEKIASTRN